MNGTLLLSVVTISPPLYYMFLLYDWRSWSICMDCTFDGCRNALFIQENLWRSCGALPLNSGAYNVLLNSSSKSNAALVATLLQFVLYGNSGNFSKRRNALFTSYIPEFQCNFGLPFSYCFSFWELPF